jgi:hypothetical protein
MGVNRETNSTTRRNTTDQEALVAAITERVMAELAKA